jgi:hypothetical protein
VYQVTHGEVLAWIGSSGASADDVDAVLSALEDIAADPDGAGVPVPGRRPVFVYGVPGTLWTITYLVAHQFRTVRIIEITTPDLA